MVDLGKYLTQITGKDAVLLPLDSETLNAGRSPLLTAGPVSIAAIGGLPGAVPPWRSSPMLPHVLRQLSTMPPIDPPTEPRSPFPKEPSEETRAPQQVNGAQSFTAGFGMGCLNDMVGPVVDPYLRPDGQQLKTKAYDAAKMFLLEKAAHHIAEKVVPQVPVGSGWKGNVMAFVLSISGYYFYDYIKSVIAEPVNGGADDAARDAVHDVAHDVAEDAPDGASLVELGQDIRSMQCMGISGCRGCMAFEITEATGRVWRITSNRPGSLLYVWSMVTWFEEFEGGGTLGFHTVYPRTRLEMSLHIAGEAQYIRIQPLADRDHLVVQMLPPDVVGNADGVADQADDMPARPPQGMFPTVPQGMTIFYTGMCIISMESDPNVLQNNLLVLGHRRPGTSGWCHRRRQDQDEWEGHACMLQNYYQNVMELDPFVCPMCRRPIDQIFVA